MITLRRACGLLLLEFGFCGQSESCCRLCIFSSRQCGSQSRCRCECLCRCGGRCAGRSGRVGGRGFGGVGQGGRVRREKRGYGCVRAGHVGRNRGSAGCGYNRDRRGRWGYGWRLRWPDDDRRPADGLNPQAVAWDGCQDDGNQKDMQTAYSPQGRARVNHNPSVDHISIAEGQQANCACSSMPARMSDKFGTMNHSLPALTLTGVHSWLLGHDPFSLCWWYYLCEGRQSRWRQAVSGGPSGRVQST